MVTRVKLSQAASIRQGYQFRSKIITDPNGEIPVIQMANIDSGKFINWKSVQCISDQIKEEHYLKPGDLIFCARGTNNYSLVIDNTVRRNSIAVSQFLVIEPDTTKLLPSYLAWFLSQKDSIDYIRSNTLMSTVPLINKITLEEMPIPLPSLEKQNTIANIYELASKENDLIQRIQSLKSKKLNTIMLSAITGRV